MTTSESEPPESEIAPPIVLDSRKAKFVALVAAAPSAALLFFWLYRAARRFGLLPGTSLGPEDAGARIDAPALWAFENAVILAIAVIPLYFAFKIWLRPTLKNLRRVPFIAVFWCFQGRIFIYALLLRFEWIDKERGLPFELVSRPLLLLMLPAYFLVKKGMVLWFKTPELARSGLQTGSRRGLWGLYCFFLSLVLVTLGGALVEHFDIPLGYDDAPVWGLIDVLASLFIPIVIAIYVYKEGLRPLGLRPE